MSYLRRWPSRPTCLRRPRWQTMLIIKPVLAVRRVRPWSGLMRRRMSAFHYGPSGFGIDAGHCGNNAGSGLTMAGQNDLIAILCAPDEIGELGFGLADRNVHEQD